MKSIHLQKKSVKWYNTNRGRETSKKEKSEITYTDYAMYPASEIDKITERII